MAEKNSSAPLKTAEGDYPALPEPATWLVVRGAFRASPHGQDAESNEWLEEAHEPGEKGSFAVYTEQQLKDFADATHAMRLKCKSEQKRLATLWGFQAAPAAVAVPDEREAFEKWAAGEGINIRTDGGCYRGVIAGACYEAWQAGAALAATPVPPATQDSSAGDLAEPTKLGLWEELNQRHLDLLQDVLDAKEVMAAAGVEQNDFASMFKLFAAKAEVQAEPVYQITRPFTGDPKDTWRDASKDAYDYSLPNKRRILYTAPQAQPADALDAAADLWYLQDTRSYVGNDVIWWAKDGKGYTTDVSKAHLYTIDEAFKQAAARGCDLAWPKAYIDGKTRPAVDMQYIDHQAAMAAAQEGGNAAKEA